MKNNIKKIPLLLLLLFGVGIIIFPKQLDNDNEMINFQEIVLGDDITPTLVTPFYSSNHFIVADIVIKSSGGDMTSAIQTALDKCGNHHGGTVWLERGIYKVSRTISIPTGCTLMGDWQDPDNYQGTLDYGTKIVVDVNNFSSDNVNTQLSGLFRLKASSGIEGLTIYYENQKISNPVNQPWSITYDSEMLMSVKNVTFINSAYGIGRGIDIKRSHEMLMIENVKGTVLKTGVLIHDSSDVGTITGLTLSPKYLAKANLKAFGDNSKNSSESSISKSIKSNGGIGLMITDAEQSQFVNINLSGFKYGIHIPNASLIQTRYMGSGSFYNLNISDCDVGILADSGIYKDKTLIDYRWGYVISNSSISGNDAAINNSSSPIGGKSGTIKLNDVKIQGKVIGSAPVIYNNNTSYIEISKNNDLTGTINNTLKYSKLNLYRKLKNNYSNFMYLSSGSSVDEINMALSSISSKGGGVVYLKPGVYQINKSVNIPANVELRGSSSSPSRYFNAGTTFNIVNNVKAIKINGNNSGIYGINIIYESNINSLNNGASYTSYDYAIVTENTKNIYIKNVSIAGASHGIYLNKCSNFAIENIVTGVLDNAIRIDNSSNGLIMNCLQNGTVICRNGLYYIDEGKTIFKHVMNPNTKKKLNYILLNGDNDIEVQNCFAYGAYIFFTAVNSTIYSINTGYDGGTGVFYKATNSNGVIINGLKMDGITLEKSGGTIGTYNTAKIGNIAENDNTSSLIKIKKKYINGLIKPSLTSITLTDKSKKEVSYDYEGDGKLSCTSSNESYAKCDININKKTVTIIPIASTSSPVVIYISSGKGVNYSSASANISVSIKLSSPTNGDVNEDSKVSAADYILVRKHLLKQSVLVGNKLKKADANGDGKVSSLDYIAIKKMIFGGNISLNAKDNIPPVIYSWELTSLTSTVVNSSSAKTTVCNLGSDNGDGLKIMEYRTTCTKTKISSIKSGCATITIDACPNSALYYKLKDSSNYSSENVIDDIGKYMIFAQVYNHFLYPGVAALNDSSSLGGYVNKCSSSSITPCIQDITNEAIELRDSDSNQVFLEHLYNGILGRKPDSSGLNSWLNQLNSGLKKEKVLEGFIGSSEAKGLFSSWGYN